MLRMIAKLALVGLAGFGAVTAGLAPAKAGESGFGVYIGTDHPPVVRVWGDDDWRNGPPPPPRWRDDRPRDWRDGPPPRWRDGGPRIEGFCSPREAIGKARYFGLRNPRIERVTPRRVVVGGWRYGEYDRVVFANRPGCPGG